jgi:hypothetical protein
MRLLPILLLMFFSLAYGQQVNPNKLLPCPQVDESASFDVAVGGRTGSWTNCWGSYRFELDASHQGDVLEGEWLDGLLHGQGTHTSANNGKYAGEFREGKFHGKGTYAYTGGDKYVGEFKKGTRHGRGTYTFAQGHRYKGEWLDGKPHGYGELTYADDRNSLKGIFKNGEFYLGEMLRFPYFDERATNSDREERLKEQLRSLEEEKRRRHDEKQRIEEEIRQLEKRLSELAN